LLGAGTLAAVACVMPGALRVAAAGASGAAAWVALAACATIPATIAVAVARGARDGARAIASDDAALAGWTVLAWLLATFIALSAFGALLRATTHHHALAGVTFALGGVAVAAFLALVVRRLAAIARGCDALMRSAILGTTIVALAAASLLVVLRAARSSGDLGLPSWTGDAVVDALAFAIATAFASRPAVTRAPWIARLGVPLALGVVGLGLALLTRDPTLVEAVRAHAPWLQVLLV
jgi:hypothetical protein